MPTTANENRPAAAVPTPADDEDDKTDDETEEASEPKKTPSPGTTTDPWIKNN